MQSLVAAARGRAPTTPRSGAPTTPRRALRQGVVSNIGNPKIALFFASLLPQFAPEGHGAFAGFLALGFLFSAMTLTWLSLYAVVVHRLRELLGGTVRRILDAATGVVLVALGLRVADERSLDEPGPRRLRGGRGAGRLTELPQDVRHVPVHGVLAEDERRGDLAVRVTGGNEPEHVRLAPRER